MSKIMLVEDDNSLREIYEARLVAEGYTVVSAKDGEEALAVALKERPDLIIADVMMPKVSGFDMLDILRSTPETKNTKIIMMTALSQAEDRARAEKLGADRYLVKSQVTLEDVTREARSILDELDKQAAATVAQVESGPTTPAVTAPTPAPTPQPATTPPPAPAPEPTTVPQPPTPVADPPKPQPTVTSIPVTAAPDDNLTPATDDNDHTDDKATEVKDEKLEETAKELSTPVKKEEAEVKGQVDEFIASNPTLSASPEPQNKAVNDAVDSLTQPDTAPEEDTKDAGRSYVAPEETGDKPQESLEHTKTITPTPESERNVGKPSLNELLAKEGDSVSATANPAVNTIITPTSDADSSATVK